MALKEQVDIDLKAAMLGGNRFEAEVLRGLKAAILNEEVAQKKRDEGLDDSTIEQLIAREIKKRNDSASQYKSAGRLELSETELKEAEVIKTYLPTQVSEAEIIAAIKSTISELGVSDMASMGQVIGAVKRQFGNSADGGLVAHLVKNALQ